MPFRLLSEFALSAWRSRRRVLLKQLEQAIRDARGPSHPFLKKGEPLRIAYLRSTPSPGNAAGGAATHIKGFVSAATELGAHG